MNRTLPKYLLEKHQLTGTVTFAILFSVVFLNLYIPFSDTAWFRLGNSVLFLFTAGFIAISILFLIASRVLMYKVRKLFRMTYLQYVLWCVAEVVVICLFYTFVTVDVVNPPEIMPAHRVFIKAFLYGSIALLVPYMLSAMYFTISEKERTIRLMNCRSGAGNAGDGDPAGAPDGGSLVSLFDNNGVLRFSVRSSDLYYIESDDNYIKVWYDDNTGKLKMYMLRCPLKSVEQFFKGTSLMRCNRKYIVNVAKVKALRKESDGYFLDMASSEIAPISVTRTYSDNILKYFSGAGEDTREPSLEVQPSDDKAGLA